MYKSVNKSVKRTLSLALVLMILFLSGSHTLASASSIAAKEIPVSKVYSFSSKDVSAKMTQSLQKHGITVDENTLLEVRPSGTGTGATELRVTQIDGNLVTDSVLMAFDENGEQVSVPVRATSSEGYSGGNYYDFDYFEDGSLVFHMSVQYTVYRPNLFGKTYINPNALMFDYYNPGSHSVEYVDIIFSTTGFEHWYPSYEALCEGYVIYSDYTRILEEYPEENFYYFASSSYPSNKVLDISTGPHNKMVLSYEIDVNGNTYYTDRPIFLNTGN